MALPIGAVPSKRIPEAVLSITEFYLRERQKDETLSGIRPAHRQERDQGPARRSDQDSGRMKWIASYYSDWGDPREFTLADMGVGECAGEVVSQAEFTLAASERELFEAQLLLDAGRPQDAAKGAYASMLRAAQGLVKVAESRHF